MLARGGLRALNLCKFRRSLANPSLRPHFRVQRNFCSLAVPKEVQEFIQHTYDNEDLVYLHNPSTNSHVCLVGTCHYHKEYSSVIRQVIETVAPHQVMLELDPKRANSLQAWADPFQCEVSLEHQIQYPFLSSLYFWMSKQKYNSVFLRENVDPVYGMDLYIALRVAEEQGASIIFGDQEQSVTIRNALREGIQKALQADRDLVLAHSLLKCNAPKVVGVVGAGHLEGIKKIWASNFN